jgi:hypothetical protein
MLLAEMSNARCERGIDSYMGNPSNFLYEATILVLPVMADKS